MESATNRFEPRDAINHAAVARHESLAALSFVALVTMVALVLWGATAGATGQALPWAAVLLGLAVGLTVRRSAARPEAGVRVLATVVTLLASLSGQFVAACTSRGISPVMALGHWGPAGQELRDSAVLAGSGLLFAVVGALLAFVLPVVGRSKGQHAR